MYFGTEGKGGNAALVDGGKGEVVRILRKAADKIEAMPELSEGDHETFPLFDYNGNTIGQAYIGVEDE